MKKLIAIALLAMSFTATAATSDDWDLADWADWCGDVWEPSVAAEADFHANMMYADNVEFQLGRHVTEDERAFMAEMGLRDAN